MQQKYWWIWGAGLKWSADITKNDFKMTNDLYIS